MKKATEQTAIRNLQTYLRQLSYSNKSIPSTPIDGIFEDATRNSLMSFQSLYGLPMTGVADQDTWEALYEAYLADKKEFDPPYALDLFPRTPDNYRLSRGDEYFLVSIIQLLLNELSIIYDSFIPLDVTGVFDANTEKNVSDFQQKQQLPISGQVDKETWNGIVNAYKNYSYDYVR